MIKLDYSLETPEERNELVQRILSDNPEPNEKYLEVLADYLILCMEKQEKKEKKILTENRLATVNKRETSFEGLVSQFENGEDGVYNLINNDKNMYLTIKAEITAEDIAEVPGLAELRDQIDIVEKQAKAATGKNKYLLKKQAIEMRQQQYILKEMWRQPHRCTTASHTGGNRIAISDEVHFDENGEPTSDAIVTFFKPDHISAILCNYEILNQELAHKYNSDFHYMLRDFKKLMREGARTISRLPHPSRCQNRRSYKCGNPKTASR